MDPVRPLQLHRPEPTALHDRAMDNLKFIRETMERSSSFTAVSGKAGVAMGLVALVTAGFAFRAGPGVWGGLWLSAALVAFCIAIVGIALKSRRVNEPLVRGPGRKFLLGMLPALVAGAALTGALYRAGFTDALPGTWLLLYGVGVLASGAFSVRVLPVMGAAFVVIGAVALHVPPGFGDAFLALGFGGLHIVGGWIIIRRHGG